MFYRELLRARCEQSQAETKALELQHAQLEEERALVNDGLKLIIKSLEHSLQRKQYVEATMSSGMSEVYSVDFTYSLQPVPTADGSAVRGLRPLLRRSGGESRNPYRRFGRGARDVQDLLYHLVMILLDRRTRPFLFFDEPFSHISREMQEKLKQFILNICRQSGAQLVIITHQDTPMGKTYEIRKRLVEGVEYSEARLKNDE